MCKKLIYLMSFVLVLAVTGTASADQWDITVPDAGFDDHVLNNVGDWIYIGDMSYTGAWKNDYGPGDGAYIDYHYWDGDLPARSGNFKAYPSDAETFDYIYQILDETFIEGGTYKLSVWVGNAWPGEGYADGWRLYFTGEDYKINLIEANGLALLGDWEQVSLVYTATAADAGKKVGIKMSGEQGESYITFEDVTLSYDGPAANFRATNPTPADGAMLSEIWVSLVWSPGETAVSHDVYLGDNFDDVNDGTAETFRGNQPLVPTTLVVGFPGFPYPDGLVPGATYYWRIDEVNDAEPNSPWKGDVWSFSIPPKTAYSPNPAEGAESIDPDVMLSWTPGFGAKLHTVYFGDNFEDLNNAAGGLPQGATTYTPGPLELAKTYYWRVDEFDAIDTYKGDVWSFTTQGAVGNPNPSNGAVDVKQTQIITWSPGIYAASHELYFGADKDAVKNADTGSPEYKGTRDLGSESYDPGKLEWDSTYYWRVDEVNNANADSPWTGILWSFTTANFLIVDDFESYNDLDPADADSNRIFNAWIDGYGDPTNGSLVGYDNPPFAEQTIVHNGNQSMPLYYDNSVGYSETTLTLTYPRDWTEKGVNSLTIWFRGNSDNAAETLYVALNGNAIVTNDNPDAAQITAWTEWTIDLQAFADQGVNLANVNTIAIGLGNKKNPVAGGSGTIYIDDIRLYPPPEPAP